MQAGRRVCPFGCLPVLLNSRAIPCVQAFNKAGGQAVTFVCRLACGVDFLNNTMFASIQQSRPAGGRQAILFVCLPVLLNY
eukprot:6238572-Lingulodinium_polyedra.AAC.1